MKMITGAILILAAVVALGFASMQMADGQLPALFGLVFLVVGVAYLIAGTPGRRKKE